LSQLQYETYMKRKAAPEDPMQPARAEASRPRSKAVAAASVPDTYWTLPSAWRPTMEDVLVEVSASGSSHAMAAAALVGGRALAQALQMPTTWPEDGSDLEGLSSALLREGLLDLKAWIRFANTASNQRSMAPRKGSKELASHLPSILPMPEKVLAVVAMLYDVGDVRQVDLSGMGLETVPLALRAFRGLRSVDLSFNRNLVSLASLASCSAVEAIRLGSCLKLTDLKPLASLTKLSAVDLSGCVALSDAGPLLAGGYEPPPNPMHDVLAGQDAPEASAQEPPHVAAKPADSPPRPGGPKVPPSGEIPGMPAASLPGTKAKAKKEPGTTAEGLPVKPSAPAATTAPEVPVANGKTDPREFRHRGLWPKEVLALGNPTLRWLSLSGCRALRKGLAHLRRCQALRFLDLFECDYVDAGEVLDACMAPQVDFVVWPSLEHLLNSARKAALSQSEVHDLMAAALDSAEEKRHLAHLEDVIHGLPACQKLAKAATRDAAARAAQDFGLPFEQTKVAKPKTSLFPELLPDESEDEEEASAEEDQEEDPQSSRGDLQACIHATAFVRRVRADGFKPTGDIQGTRLFRILDADRDGVLSKKDFGFLDLSLVPPHEVNEAIGLLLRRHQMLPDVVASDLAGHGSQIDLKRVVECMVIAGVEEEIAKPTAQVVAYCTKAIWSALLGHPAACRLALQHSIGAFVIAYKLSLLESFKSFLVGRWENCMRGFRRLTDSKHVRRQDFLDIMEGYEWDDGNPSVLETVYNLLDRDGSGLVREKDFAALEEFKAEEFLDAMSRVGRALLKFPQERPGRLAKMSLDLRFPPKDQEDRGIGRASFVEAWQDMGSRAHAADAKIVFGLLDFDGDGRIYRDRFLILCDALPRRAEIFALADLSQHLVKTFGSLPDAYAAFANISGEEASPSNKKAKAAAEAGRRASFAF